MFQLTGAMAEEKFAQKKDLLVNISQFFWDSYGTSANININLIWKIILNVSWDLVLPLLLNANSSEHLQHIKQAVILSLSFNI